MLASTVPSVTKSSLKESPGPRPLGISDQPLGTITVCISKAGCSLGAAWTGWLKPGIEVVSRTTAINIVMTMGTESLMRGIGIASFIRSVGERRNALDSLASRGPPANMRNLLPTIMTVTACFVGDLSVTI